MQTARRFQAAAVRGDQLRPMVKRILRKYKQPPDEQEAAVELARQQSRALAQAWS